jgi:chromate transporter
VFFKVNWLSVSGPASVSLLYEELVGKDISEKDFVDAVGFANFLPGSDAIQMAILIAYPLAGWPGAVAAVLGATLPPVLSVLLFLQVLQQQLYHVNLAGFSKGLEAAVIALIGLIGWKFLRPDPTVPWSKRDLTIAGLALLALLAGVPSPLVLALAGILGVFFYR